MTPTPCRTTTTAATTDANMDWDSEMDAFIQFVAASKSDFGTAQAVIKFDYDYDSDYNNEAIGCWR